MKKLHDHFSLSACVLFSNEAFKFKHKVFLLFSSSWLLEQWACSTGGGKVPSIYVNIIVYSGAYDKHYVL